MLQRDIDLLILSEGEAVALLEELLPKQLTKTFALGLSIDAIYSLADEMKRAKTLNLVSACSSQLLAQNYEDTNSSLRSGAPWPSDIRSIVNAARALKPGDRVLVHCKAGVARSVSAGIIILCTRGMTLEAATAHVLEIRPQGRPNALMLKLFAEFCDSEEFSCPNPAAAEV